MRLFRILRSSIGNGSTSSTIQSQSVAQEKNPRNVLKKVFGKYLLLTNTLSAGFLMVAGDLAAQEFEYRTNRKNSPQQDVRVERINWTRVGQMFLVGAMSGPPHHVFYKWLDKLIPAATTTAVIKKIGLDQLIFSPICIFVFFYGAGLVEGHPVRDSTNELKQKFWTVYKTDWTVWPAAQFINFYFLPPHYRVLYVNVVTTLYNVFLSHIKHKDMSGDKDKDEPLEGAEKVVKKD